MAWYSSARDNKGLVENLWKNGLIKDARVKDAFLKVDRAHYAPRHPYEDSPQDIGYRATISAPHMHATAVGELLSYVVPSEVNPAPRVLDIGSGSGYLTHVVAELVGEKGTVVGVEHIKELRDLGERNMRKSEGGRQFLEEGRVKFRVGDGRKGWVEQEDDDGGGDGREGVEEVKKRRGKGWDAIHVGASAVKLHDELVEQLRAPGRMFIPIDDEDGGIGQHVWAVDKDADGKLSRRKLFGVMYVPLTDAPKG